MTVLAAFNLGVACLVIGILITLYIVRARGAPDHGSQRPLLAEKATTSDENPRPLTSIDQPLPQWVLEPDEGTIDRAEWVQRITDHVFNARHGQRYNVLTIHTNIDFHFVPTGVVERIPVTYNDIKKTRFIPYEIIVFQRGSLVRLGDGGYINWCFSGNFDREGEFVTFKDITH
jgi:hypothetical protein